MKIKWPNKNKQWLIWLITTNIISLIVWFYWWSWSSFSNEHISWGTVVNENNWTINNWDIINELSEVEEWNRKKFQEDAAKISGFFRYRNAYQIDSARNNIYHWIWYKFNEDEMIDFRNNLTDIFRISRNKQRDSLVSSDFLIITKHEFVLSYEYNWNKYEDTIYAQVRTEPENKMNHHLDDIYCPFGWWPFCSLIE